MGSAAGEYAIGPTGGPPQREEEIAHSRAAMGESETTRPREARVGFSRGTPADACRFHAGSFHPGWFRTGRRDELVGRFASAFGELLVAGVEPSMKEGEPEPGGAVGQVRVVRGERPACC